jgi:pyridoxal phosphate-dependent aminotransferase EpsN
MANEQNSRIFLSPPHIGEREMMYVTEAFQSNWIAPVGPHLDAFEKEVAAFVGSKGAVALSTGTAGIHLALKLVGVGAGDLVFCSDFTFAASANPILYERAIPVFIDSEPCSWNMSPQALKKAFADAKSAGTLPKAVIIVHLFGQSADMDPLVEICEDYSVPIIEDAAESLGATYKGKQSGTFGKFGVFSFNGNKIITTSGGGMLVSDDLGLLDKARYLATQARDPAIHYEHSQLGYNYRLSNILAGIGRAQLEVLPDRIIARRTNFQRYYDQLSSYKGIRFMPELENCYSTRWLTTMLVDESVAGVTSTQIIESLAEGNIEARPLWKPMHLQPLYKGRVFYPHEEEKCISEDLFRSGICLPSGSNLSLEEQSRVIECIQSCLNQN